MENEENVKSTYVPDLNILETQKQQYSRNNHSFNRGKAFKFTKMKNNIITKYTNNEHIFALSLIKNNIKFIDCELKENINNIITNYELNLKKIVDAKTEDEVNNIINHSNKYIKSLNTLINKDNFEEYVFKGFFKNIDDINLRDTPEYITKYTELKEKGLLDKTKFERYLEESAYKKNVSYASVVRKNT